MLENVTGKKRNIDVVFCIDGTGSMYPCLESVKNNARRFHLEFVSAMTDLGSEIDSMRVKVIVFRDYEYDGAEAMVESPFFELPDDDSEFSDFLAKVSASGGGDGPENGLEALYLAMKSDFTTGPNDRQVIVMFSDANALELKHPTRVTNSTYPADMVDYDGLQIAWMCATQDSSFKLREKNKRLVMFAPDGTKYKEISTGFNRTIFEPVDMADGLKDIDFKDIIKIIAASASNA